MKRYFPGIAAVTLAFFGISCPKDYVPKVTYPHTKAFVEFLSHEFQKPEVVRSLSDMIVDHSTGAEAGGIVALCKDELRLVRSENLVIVRKKRLGELAEKLENSANQPYEKRHEAFEVLRLELEILFREYFSSYAGRCNPESVADGYWDVKHEYFKIGLSRITGIDDTRMLLSLARDISKELNNRLHFSKVKLDKDCLDIGEIHTHNNKSPPSGIDHCIYTEVITQRYGFVLSFQPGDAAVDIYGILNGRALNSASDGKEMPFVSVNMHLYRN